MNERLQVQGYAQVAVKPMSKKHLRELADANATAMGLPVKVSKEAVEL